MSTLTRTRFSAQLKVCFKIEHLLFVWLFISGCSDTMSKNSLSRVTYDKDLTVSVQDSLSFKSTKRRYISINIADSSNSFSQIKNDSIFFYLSTGQYEGSYIMNVIILNDSMTTSFKYFDNHSKYTYKFSSPVITLDKKPKVGEYVIAQIDFNAIGSLNNRNIKVYDTVTVSGKIRLKVRDGKFTHKDLAEESDRNRFYMEARQNPETVKRLVLYGSKWMSRLPKELSLFKNLEELYLDGTDLSKDDLEIICNLTKLRILSLQECNLSTIPNCFNSLKGLEELSLYSNNLVNIPNAIYGLSSLKDLQLGLNGISSISPSIRNLSNLESFGIQYSKVKRLPDAMSYLNKLKEIDVNDTMQYIPKSLRKYIQGDYIQE